MLTRRRTGGHLSNTSPTPSVTRTYTTGYFQAFSLLPLRRRPRTRVEKGLRKRRTGCTRHALECRLSGGAVGSEMPGGEDGANDRGCQRLQHYRTRRNECPQRVCNVRITHRILGRVVTKLTTGSYPNLRSSEQRRSAQPTRKTRTFLTWHKTL